MTLEHYLLSNPHTTGPGKMIINPEVHTTPEVPSAFIREPYEKIAPEFDKVLNRLLHAQGWGLGTRFHLHFISHDRKRLLMSGTFLVVSVEEELRTNDMNPSQPHTTNVVMRRCVQLGEWIVVEDSTEEAPDGGDLTVERNVEKGVWEVKRGEAVLAEEKTKPKAHERALEMSRGRAA